MSRSSPETGPADDLLERLDDQGLYNKAERIQMIKDAAAEIRRQSDMLQNREEFIANKGLWKEFSAYLAEPHEAKPGLAPTPDLWRPIETAQKDGTDILLHYDGRAPVVAAWFRNGWAPMDMGGNHLLGEPTHWMPLPQGPDTSTDREGE